MSIFSFLDPLKQLGSPKYTYTISGQLFPWLLFVSLGLMLYGVVGGLFLAPPDYQQGDGFRILYVHVPSAFLSLAIYSFIFINSVVFLIWRIKLADIFAKASLSMGATFTFIALFSGALWGKPMWGTWWIWDARLTSELILFFLYLGIMGLRTAIRDENRSAKACAILSIVGMVDVPIIHFSVEWWATLHQGATLAKFAKPSIANEMLYPLLVMIAGFSTFYAALLCVRVRTEILKREWKTEWVRSLMRSPNTTSLPRGVL